MAVELQAYRTTRCPVAKTESDAETIANMADKPEDKSCRINDFVP
jgi:hypothetical protein